MAWSRAAQLSAPFSSGRIMSDIPENEPGRYVFVRHICLHIRGRVHAENPDDASGQADAVMMGAACALRDLYGELDVAVEPQAVIQRSVTYCEADDD